jgi:hypothetical protein
MHPQDVGASSGRGSDVTPMQLLSVRHSRPQHTRPQATGWDRAGHTLSAWDKCILTGGRRTIGGGGRGTIGQVTGGVTQGLTVP